MRTAPPTENRRRTLRDFPTAETAASQTSSAASSSSPRKSISYRIVVPQNAKLRAKTIAAPINARVRTIAPSPGGSLRRRKMKEGEVEDQPCGCEQVVVETRQDVRQVEGVFLAHLDPGELVLLPQFQRRMKARVVVGEQSYDTEKKGPEKRDGGANAKGAKW